MSDSAETMRERECSHCGDTNLAECFYREARASSGLSAICRSCNKDRRRGAHTKGNGGYGFPEQRRARERLRDAVRYGKIAKPSLCQRCGVETPKHLLDGHHSNYAKPLDVEWLCRSCHGVETFAEKRHG